MRRGTSPGHFRVHVECGGELTEPVSLPNVRTDHAISYALVCTARPYRPVQERDIQELLASWAQHLASAQLVFVHAPSSNSKAIFGTTGNAGTPGAPTSPLMASDPRVRRVPFMTQRPTFSEIKRVARLLSSVFEVRPEQVVSPAEAAAAVAAAAAEEEAKREAAKAAKAEAEQQRRREEAAGSGEGTDHGLVGGRDGDGIG